MCASSESSRTHCFAPSAAAPRTDWHIANSATVPCQQCDATLRNRTRWRTHISKAVATSRMATQPGEVLPQAEGGAYVPDAVFVPALTAPHR